MMAPILTKHMNKAEAREKALELLDKVGLKDKADAADIAQKMADGINPRKWVCVEADELTVVSKDNIIMLFMADHELYSMDDAVAAFTEVCGNPDNNCQPK